jgi:hypothetical protein
MATLEIEQAAAYSSFFGHADGIKSMWNSLVAADLATVDVRVYKTFATYGAWAT